MHTRPALAAIPFLVAIGCFILAAGALSAPSFGAPPRAPRTPGPLPAAADSLPWHDLAGLLVERMALLPGERVLLLGSHGRFDAIVDPLRHAVADAGGVVAGAYTVRPPESGGAGAGPWDGVLDGEMVELQRQLADVDVGVMLPGPSAGDAAYAALQRNLEELGGPRRTVHFHWQGAYGHDNLLREPDAIIDAAYVDALLNTDYAALAAAQAEWIDRARRGEIRVTTPEGTDIAFRIGDRPVTRQDGDASAARALRARNLIDREIELPAGAIRVAPIEESVHGVIAFPPTVWRGEEVRGLRMWFEAGKLTRWESDAGTAAVQADLDEGGEAARSFRELALGFNPQLRVRWHPSLAEAWIPYYGYGDGVIRLSLGDNTELGGMVSGGYVRWNFFVGGRVDVRRR